MAAWPTRDLAPPPPTPRTDTAKSTGMPRIYEDAARVAEEFGLAAPLTLGNVWASCLFRAALSKTGVIEVAQRQYKADELALFKELAA